jgi:hypothetical protein
VKRGKSPLLFFILLMVDGDPGEATTPLAEVSGNRYSGFIRSKAISRLFHDKFTRKFLTKVRLRYRAE